MEGDSSRLPCSGTVEDNLWKLHGVIQSLKIQNSGHAIRIEDLEKKTTEHRGEIKGEVKDSRKRIMELECRAQKTDKRLIAIESQMSSILSPEKELKTDTEERKRIVALENLAQKMDLSDLWWIAEARYLQAAGLLAAPAQVFPSCVKKEKQKEETTDILSFISACKASLEFSRNGEVRMIFHGDEPIPLCHLTTTFFLLQKHDPKGTIDVFSREGEIVVRLQPQSSVEGA